MGGQLLAEVPHLAPVTGQLLTQTLARPGAGVQRPLELKWPMRTCEAGCHGRHYLHRVTAGGGQGRAAVSADHGVDGVHPGLQLLLV